MIRRILMKPRGGTAELRVEMGRWNGLTEFVNNVAWERWWKKITFCGNVKL